MSYDFYGAWSKTTGHNAPMYNDPANPAMIDRFSVAESMDVFLGLWNQKCKATYGPIEHKVVNATGMPRRTTSATPESNATGMRNPKGFAGLMFTVWKHTRS
ncbi:MAG: hypothetical protein KVP17_000465 [Porospora cf. gigantea B]|uniref:uncharacterized protein n=1 Tax=Porospora cf. gigantea B TaxID=2853592 RepID=UPI0035718ACB|nr:MAG: hypothetical protein KVP17_000465 [Porospora cf. gigantea B]